jgi:hypothetical protein
VHQACIDYCAVEVACGTEWADEAACNAWCEANLDEAASFSMFCRQAWEAVQACVGGLDCEQFAAWDDPTAFPYPCSTEDAALQYECEGQ